MGAAVVTMDVAGAEKGDVVYPIMDEMGDHGKFGPWSTWEIPSFLIRPALQDALVACSGLISR